MYFEKLVSAIINDTVSGLKGYHCNLSLNRDLLADEIVNVRLNIIEQLKLSGTVPYKDLLLSINCVNVDCLDLERCYCGNYEGDPVAHFEIPQIVTLLGIKAIDYIGSIDRMNRFQIITSLSDFDSRKYRKFQSKKPRVWIDLTPNKNGMLDCFIFDAPLIKTISVVAIFKDPRQLNLFGCCSEFLDDNYSYISTLIKDKLVAEKVQYYRQQAAPNTPNDQTYKTGS